VNIALSAVPSFPIISITAFVMNNSSTYTPPKIWAPNKENGGRFANINRPTAGPTHQKELPVGRHPLQLYSLGTPNGVKVTVMLEELLAAGHSDAEYDAWLIRINEGDQFGSGFVEVNPNSKIPALVDRSGPTPIRVFESGAILIYLAGRANQGVRGRFPKVRLGCVLCAAIRVTNTSGGKRRTVTAA
jgi:hypothetical protein